MKASERAAAGADSASKSKESQDSQDKDRKAAKKENIKPDERYTSPEFMMFGFKILMCKKKSHHDWKVCPFAHPAERAKRRCRRHAFAAMCPDTGKPGGCPRGDDCDMAHSAFEFWLHPERFRTEMCHYGSTCNRPWCWFAHDPSQLRAPCEFVGAESPFRFSAHHAHSTTGNSGSPKNNSSGNNCQAAAASTASGSNSPSRNSSINSEGQQAAGVAAMPPPASSSSSSSAWASTVAAVPNTLHGSAAAVLAMLERMALPDAAAAAVSSAQLAVSAGLVDGDMLKLAPSSSTTLACSPIVPGCANSSGNGPAVHLQHAHQQQLLSEPLQQQQQQLLALLQLQLQQQLLLQQQQHQQGWAGAHVAQPLHSNAASWLLQLQQLQQAAAASNGNSDPAALMAALLEVAQQVLGAAQQLEAATYGAQASVGGQMPLTADLTQRTPSSAGMQGSLMDATAGSLHLQSLLPAGLLEEASTSSSSQAAAAWQFDQHHALSLGDPPGISQLLYGSNAGSRNCSTAAGVPLPGRTPSSSTPALLGGLPAELGSESALSSSVLSSGSSSQQPSLPSWLAASAGQVAVSSCLPYGCSLQATSSRQFGSLDMLVPARRPIQVASMIGAGSRANSTSSSSPVAALMQLQDLSFLSSQL